MKNYHEKLEPDCVYHLYNRAIGNEQLFTNAENYRFFLQKYLNHVSPIADTLSYCLMPNHFHFIIRCKGEGILEAYFNNRACVAGAKSKTLTGFLENSQTPSGFVVDRNTLLSNLLSQQFSHLFNSYTQALNKVNARMGGLFMRPFNRIRVKDETYLKKLVIYIHLNPVSAGFCRKPQEWIHSSYNQILNKDGSLVVAPEILSLFDDLENFRIVHEKKSNWLPENL